MRVLKSMVVAVAALGAVEFVAAHSPLSLVSQAHADALPAVWRNKAKKLVKQIEGTRQALAGFGEDRSKMGLVAKRIDSYRIGLAKIPPADDPARKAAEAALAALEQDFAAAQAGGVTAPTQPAAAAPAQSPEAPARSVPGADRDKLKRAAESLTNDRRKITAEGPSTFQDPKVAAEIQRDLEYWNETIDRYDGVDAPEVVEARAARAAFRAAFEAEKARAAEQLAIVGDVSARLTAIQNRDAEVPNPAALRPPFTREQANAWALAIRTSYQAALDDKAALEQMTALAHMPHPLSARHNRESRSVAARMAAAGERYAETRELIKRDLGPLMRRFEAPTASTSPAEMARDQAAFDTAIALVESAIHLDAALDRPTAEAEKALAGIVLKRKAYEAALDASVETVTMPEAQSNDPEMLAFAKEVMGIEKYGFEEYGPIVLTSTEITDDSRIEKEIRTSGTQLVEETTTYKWKAFVFWVPVKDGENWFLYRVVARNYSSGARTTPKNKWIAGDTGRMSRILPKAFGGE